MTWFPGEDLLKKMWETIADKGIGNLLKPWHLTREERAHTEARKNDLLVMAQAKHHANEIEAGRMKILPNGALLQISQTDYDNVFPMISSEGRIEPSLYVSRLAENVSARNVADGIRSDVNVAHAVIMAEEILSHDNQPASDETVDDDWLYAWRDHASNVSNDELQRLWAKLLAGEIKNPGTFSLRTLEFVRTLSKAEATAISQLAAFIISGIVVCDDTTRKIMENNRVGFSLFFKMGEIGILNGIQSPGVNITYDSELPDRFYKSLKLQNIVLTIECQGQRTLELNGYPLTTLGDEVLLLGTFTANEEYAHAIIRKLILAGYQVSKSDVIEELGGKRYTHSIGILQSY